VTVRRFRSTTMISTIISTMSASLGALALVAVGCGGGTHSINNSCPKIQSQGGDPRGRWGVTSSCQVPYARTASDDLCSKLVYDGSGVKDGLILGQEFLPILAPSTIRFETPPGEPCGPDGTCGTYNAQLVFSGMATTNFPMGCLAQHQAHPTCADLEKKMEALIDTSVLATVRQHSLSCVDEANGDGCDCTYLITTANLAPDVGAWRLEGDQLVIYLGTAAQAGVVDFSVVGDSMSMHGHDGMPLLAHDPVRNLDLVRCTAGTVASGICPCDDQAKRDRQCACDADAAKRGICTM
jgi:hypothetical protein